VDRKAAEALDAGLFIVRFRQRGEAPAWAPETAC
jgi:hypothetical protein